MQQAINISTRGIGLTWPNPSVGCIIVKQNLIIGRGVTQVGGRPHAEQVALEMAGDKAKNSTVYVSLEPCCHTGVTAPCADALIQAGVKRVVIASLDPDKRVSGSGLMRLKKAGIDVISGILEKEAREVNEGYFKSRNESLPYVTLKVAVTVDSKTATYSGDSHWITNRGARQHSHMLRARHDVIIVSSSTAISDNPELTCRLPGMKKYSPTRVLLDAFRKAPNSLKLFKNIDEIPLWIFTSLPKNDPINQESIKLGAKVVNVPNDSLGYGLDLTAVFKELVGLGITRVMVESGSQLSSALFQEKLVDKLVVYRAPSLIGGDGLSLMAGINLKKISESIRLKLDDIKEFENTVIETYRVLK